MVFLFSLACFISLIIAGKTHTNPWYNLYPIAAIVIASYTRYRFIRNAVNDRCSERHRQLEQSESALAKERQRFYAEREPSLKRKKELDDAFLSLAEKEKEIDGKIIQFEEDKGRAMRYHIAFVKEIAQLNGIVAVIARDDILLSQTTSCIERIQSIIDVIQADELLMRKVPAIRAEEKVREANKRARIAEREFLLAKRRVDLYEWYAPWLAECTDCSLQDILNEIRNPTDEQTEDPVRVYLKDKTQDEWNTMDEASRNQLALERYWSRRRYGPWEAGIQYERFVGYVFEKKGYDVAYHGAIAGKMDHGIDLIARKDGKVLIIQCKRLSQDKGIPVRENVIAQVYGSAKFYALQHGYSEVQPLLFTSFEVSEDARKFAELLGVYVKERFELKPYPCIKCNAGKDGSKIYHLPFDQLYDRVKIKAGNGEFYASTAHEAEALGFRRAWRWRGE